MKTLKLDITHRLGVLLLLCVMVLIASCEKEDRPLTFEEEIYVSLEELKSFYKGEDVVINGQNRFRKILVDGVVTSSAAGSNLPFDQGVVVQEGRSGLAFRFGDDFPASLEKGDSVQMNVVSGVLSGENGNALITGVAASDITVLSEGNDLSPRTVAVAELHANPSDYVGALVKVVGAEVLEHQDGQVFAGAKKLEDGTGGEIELYTRQSAGFSGESLPLFGTFTGIVRLGSDQSTIQLLMRDLDDYEAYTPSPYPPGFPEHFDTDLVKDAYASANLNLNSGDWTFDGVTLVTKTDARPITEDGTKAVQFNQRNAEPLYLQMNFDVYRGASKVSIAYGSYGSDPGTIWRLEYSTNGGVSWSQVGDDVVTENKAAQVKEFDMDISGQVRFRIQKLPLGADNNGRLNIDDFIIYNQ